MNNVVNQRRTLTTQDSFVIKQDGVTEYESLSYTEFKKAVLQLAQGTMTATYGIVDIGGIYVPDFLEIEGFAFIDLATNPGVQIPVYLPEAEFAGQRVSIVPYVADNSVLTGLKVYKDDVDFDVLTAPYSDITYIADETLTWRRF